MDGREFDALLARLEHIEGSSLSADPSNRAQGTLRHLTPEAALRGIRSVRSGRVIACADRAAGQHVVGGRSAAGDGLLTSVEGAGDWAAVNDRLTIDLHGPSVQTHLDALGHFYYRGRGYAGTCLDTEVTAHGLLANDVIPAAAGIVGRGLLLDLPLVTDTAFVPSERPVPLRELAAWLDEVGARPQPGDLLFVRTGRPLSPRVAPGSFFRVASLDLDCAEWIAENRFSVVLSDSGMDSPVAVVAGVPTPWHIALLVALGTWLVDSTDLEELAQACAEEGRYEFLATIGPMPLVGASASPVNPVVVL